jgi:hypothetical protein
MICYEKPTNLIRINFYFLDLFYYDFTEQALSHHSMGEYLMYIDSYVISGLIIVALTCVVVGYVGYFGYKHIKEDMAKADKKSS